MHKPSHFLISLPFRTIDGIRGNVIKRGERNMISQLLHVKSDKEAIATWNLDLNRIRRVFDVRSVTPV